jgi:hypothetical protein
MPGRLGINPQQIVADQARVNMKVQMRDLLIRSGTCRVPDAQTIAWKLAIDSPRHQHGHSRQCFGGRHIQGSNVWDVPAGYH